MAKQKKRADNTSFLVRLPKEYQEKLLEVKKQTDIPVTAIVRRAIDFYLAGTKEKPGKST